MQGQHDPECCLMTSQVCHFCTTKNHLEPLPCSSCVGVPGFMGVHELHSKEQVENRTLQLVLVAAWKEVAAVDSG